MRRGLLQRKAAVGVDQVLGEMPEGAGLHVHDGQRTLSGREGHAHRAAHALLVAVFGLQFVDHQFHEVALVAVEGVHLRKVAQLAVDAHAREALAAQLVEEFAVMPLASAHQRREQQALAVAVAAHYQVDYLRVGVADQLPAGHRRIRGRRLGVEQAQEVVDLGDGADRGAGVGAGGLLLDGDYRAQPADALHRRLLEYAHEVLGVGGEGVHVAALPLGIDGVEGQRGFSAAADSGDHREPAPRDVHVHALEVVGAGSAYFYVLTLVHGRREGQIYQKIAYL